MHPCAKQSPWRPCGVSFHTDVGLEWVGLVPSIPAGVFVGQTEGMTNFVDCNLLPLFWSISMCSYPRRYVALLSACTGAVAAVNNDKDLSRMHRRFRDEIMDPLAVTVENAALDLTILSIEQPLNRVTTPEQPDNSE